MADLLHSGGRVRITPIAHTDAAAASAKTEAVYYGLPATAANMTGAFPEGWKFVVDRKDARGEAGHFEVFRPFTPDEQQEH